jgi:hypothetical protein
MGTSGNWSKIPTTFSVCIEISISQIVRHLPKLRVYNPAPGIRPYKWMCGEERIRNSWLGKMIL